MQLSTKSRYGTRAMLDLAINNDCRNPVSVRSISKRQNIPLHYLEQILNKLKKAGLVKSVRGANGGYFLAKKPDEIRIWDIVDLLEGSMSLVGCLGEDAKCERVERCVTRLLWATVTEKIRECLNTVTLADLCNQARNFE